MITVSMNIETDKYLFALLRKKEEVPIAKLRKRPRTPPEITRTLKTIFILLHSKPGSKDRGPNDHPIITPPEVRDSFIIWYSPMPWQISCHYKFYWYNSLKFNQI
jgi:hypothetical protein